MNTYFSLNTLKDVFSHLPTKIGITTLTLASGFFQQVTHIFLLIGIFFVLACLDVATRWWACGAKLWKDLYPQTEGNLWRYMKFMRQAHRWRYFRSDKMRDQFVSKIGTYITIILFAVFGDAAMSLVHGIPFLSVIVISILSCTEMISCLENLDECNVSVAKEIMNLVKKRKEAIK